MDLLEKVFITLKGYYPSAPDVRHEFVSNEILSLLGENETGVSGSQDKHGDLQPVSESNASTSGEPEHGTLEKITEGEKKCKSCGQFDQLDEDGICFECWESNC